MSETKHNPSYLSPKLELQACPGKGGYGLFALEPLAKDEVLAVWGGVVVPDERLHDYSEYAQTHGLQVEDNLYLLPLTEDDPSDYFNHSCSPNAGLLGQITLVAMRPIQAGEEICFDYAMSDSNPYDEFDCGCGTPHCRGRITADDWKRPDLQERYQGYFSPYLQRRMQNH
jgi:SET domain-containing protein